MKKRVLCFALLLAMGVFTTNTTFAAGVSTQTSQQTKPAKGIVKDASGVPIIGATVVIQGTTKGVGTGLDGDFLINDVPTGSTLSVSMIGYKTLNVPFNGSVLDITLEEDVVKLNEVVVVGYGSQSKVNLTGAVVQVSGKELEDRPLTSLSTGLQGLLPGVTITASSGAPGMDGGSIRVRGVGTLNSSNPYILIDGIEAGSMNQIDPNDVATITVLKDAASAAIYGSKASNGVILITTKRGKMGKATVSYNGYAGFQNQTKNIDRLSSADYATLYNQALVEDGKKARFTPEEVTKFRDGSDPYKYPNTDWLGLAYKTGFQHQHNVNISGGTETVRYLASVGFLGQDGILAHSNRRQFNARTNLDIILSPKFTARINLSYINNSYQDPTASYGGGGGSGQLIRQLNLIAPWIANKNEDGTYGTIADGNPIAWLDLNQTVKRANENVVGVAALDYNIVSGLKATAQVSYVSNTQNYSEFIKDIQYNPNKYHGPNSLSERYYTWNRSSFDGTINYDKQWGAHAFKAMVGYHAESYNNKELQAKRTGFISNDLTDMNAGAVATQTNSGFTRQLNMMSYFARVNYDYKGKYLFEANFRSDASSRFSPDTRWGYFPSVSAGWRISEEKFMEGASGWMQNLKLRGSWGKLGNQDALSDYYPWMSTYSLGQNYPFDGGVQSGVAQTNYRLSTITWEETRTWGIGLEMALFNGLNVSVEYYDRKTNGIIMDVPVPSTFGLGAYKDNVGSMSNRGIEFSVNYQKTWGDWSFSAGVNGAYNKNELLDLGGVEFMDNGNLRRQVGYEFDSYYRYETDGKFQTQAEADAYTAKYGNPFGKKFKAGDFRYRDTNGKDANGNLTGEADGKLTADDRVLGNSQLPRFNYGITLSAGWKGIDVSMMFTGAAGVSRYFDREAFGYFAGDAQHPSTVWLDAWSETNPGGKYPRVANDLTSPSNPQILSDFWVMNADFLRLKNLQVGYTFPARWMKKGGVSKLRIYYSGENLLTFDKLDLNIDPEATTANGSHYPLMTTHTFGINLTF